MSGRSFEEEAHIPASRYFDEAYMVRMQFDTLISQILAVVKMKPKTILEVGPGNGFVTAFLRSAGYHVTTFDINENLRPDVVGNLVEIDKYFSADAFDLVLCAEVLEHIPFKYFESILTKFKAISRRTVIVTLPRRHRILIDLKLFLKVPFVRPLRLNIFRRISDNQKWEGHHWEIDYRKEYSLGSILKIANSIFEVRDCYADERVRNHQYFILYKRSAERLDSPA